MVVVEKDPRPRLALPFTVLTATDTVRLPFAVQAHPAERRSVNGSLTLCTGSCSCCCCLHSIGSLSGALAASETSVRKGVKGAAGIYWLGVIGLTAILPFIFDHWFFIALIGMPIIQLVGSALACLAITLPFFQPKRPYYEAVLRITVWTISGTLVPIAIVAVVFLLLHVLGRI